MNKYQHDVHTGYWEVWARSLAHCARVIREEEKHQWVRQLTSGALEQARTISPKLFTRQVAYLLWGLALENLVKKLLIRLDPALVTPEGLKKPLLSHDLTALFARAGFALSQVEQAAVQTATQAVVWSGKYPYPRRAGAQPHLHWRSADVDEVLPSLYSRLLDAVTPSPMADRDGPESDDE